MSSRRHSLPLESLAVASRWDVVIEAGLYALLAFLPLAFGTVEAWSELVLYAACTVLTLVALYRAVATGSWRLGSWASWIVVACVLVLPLYAAVQSFTLPRQIVATIAPANAAAYDAHLADLEPPPTEASISLNRNATARRARLLAAASAIVLVVAMSFRSSASLQRLLLAVFLIGLAEATLGLAQIATFTSQIFWTYGEPGGKTVTGGSFVNYSHFAQFVNLSLGFGLALWLVRTKSSGPRASAPPAMRSWRDLRLAAGRQSWLLVGMAVAALAVAASMSRNGILSMTVAAIVTGGLLWRRGTLDWRGWALGAVPGAVLLILLFTALDDVYLRLATLQDGDSSGGRWELTQGALRAWQAFPAWGVGCDAHAVVFPLFDTAVSSKLAEHADNDYAQWLEELGVIGSAIVVMLVAALVVVSWRLMFRGRRGVAQASFGMIFGLLAVAIHSTTDFGQRIPAVFALTAVACGALLALDRHERIAEARVGGHSTKAAILRFLPVGSCAALVWGLIVWGGYRSYAAEQWWWTTLAVDERIAAAPEFATQEDYADLNSAAELAAQWAPRNAEYGYWLNSYRWQTLQGAFFGVDGPVNDPEAVQAARQIADDLTRVRALAPTYGPPMALEGQIRLQALGEQRGAELVQSAVLLAPYDPHATFFAGTIAAQQGRTEDADKLLAHAVALLPAYFNQAAPVYLDVLDRPDRAVELAGDDPARLGNLATLAEDRPERAKLAVEVGKRMADALRRRAANDEATAAELADLARIEALTGEFANAEKLYRRSLGLEYGNLTWRLALARSLAAQQRYEDAIREARILLRLRPDHTEATKLIGEWSVLVPADGAD